ncbi:MAG TPA: FG-GAP-like repeat-containing protein [Flavobacteriales bacterium]|nr:FG-GAP-like repeat-containing protein [Flavobacteriales bacterium]
MKPWSAITWASSALFYAVPCAAFGQFAPPQLLGRTEIVYPREIHVLQPDAAGPSDLLVAGSVHSRSVFALFRDAGTLANDRPDYVLTLPGLLMEHQLLDLDEDGNKDLIVAYAYDESDPDTVQWYRGLGDGTFADGIFVCAEVGNSHQFAVADINGDGLLDLLHSHNRPYPTPSSVDLYPRTGPLTFGPVEVILNTANTTMVLEPGDLDGDGDADLVLGDPDINVLRTFLNNGSGQLTETASMPVVDVGDLLLHDLDVDGDLDLLCATDRVTLFRNDGTGMWTAGTELMPCTGSNFGVRDINGDGLPDVWSIRWTTISPVLYQLQWRLNDGAGGFSAASMRNLNYQDPPLAWTDVDNDGRLDIVTSAMTYHDHLGYRPMDAEGELGELLVLSQGMNAARRISTADLDNDGDQDVVVQCIQNWKTTWLENNGTAYWPEHIVWEDISGHLSPADVICLDADGDGDIDLLHRTRSNDIAPVVSTHWYLNDGAGTFAYGGLLGSAAGISYPGGLQKADLNNDGVLDIIQYVNGIQYWQGLPGGGFATSVYLIANMQGVQAIGYGAVGDVDDDGDMDIVATSGYRPCFIENNGSQQFATPQIFGGTYLCEGGITLRDMDGDGDLDAAMLGQDDSQSIGVWFENEDGYYLQRHTIASMGPYALVAEDVDADGDVDVIGILNNYYGSALLWRNDGTGEFGAPYPAVPGTYPIWNLAVGDLDGNGALDLISNVDNEELWWQPGFAGSAFGVTGTVFLDVNGNGLQEVGEPGLPNATLSLDPDSAAVSQEADGSFSISGPPGPFTLTATAPPGAWQATTASAVEFVLTVEDPMVDGVSFGFAPVLEVAAVQLHALGAFPACAGPAPYWLTIRNTGNTLLSGTVKCGVDPLLQFSSAIPPPDGVVGDTLIWTVEDLAPSAEWTAIVLLTMPGVASQGEQILNGMRVVLQSTSGASVLATTTTTDTVVCAGASTQLICVPGGEGDQHTVPLATPSLEYTVHFRNMGTDTLHTATIVAPLFTPLLHQEVALVASSHPASMFSNSTNTGTYCFITLSGMDLPPIGVDPAGSHGFVTYRVPVDNGTAEHGDRIDHYTELSLIGASYTLAYPGDVFVTLMDCDAFVPQIRDTLNSGIEALYTTYGFAEYNWYLDGGALGSFDAYHIPTASGLYTVEVVDELGCSAVVGPYYWGSTDLASLEEDTAAPRVYPNPASTHFIIDTGSATAPQRWGIFDMAGRRISEVLSNGAAQTVVQRGDLAAGTYILRALDKAAGDPVQCKLLLH